MSTTAYVGLGSNLGDRHRLIQQALDLMRQAAGVTVLRVSGVVETPSLAGMDQPMYLNAVCQIETSLEARLLLERLREIESGLGRVRTHRWASRTMDLDLLLFGDQVIDLPDLKVPHPEMHLRSFVLEGLRQLTPAMVHPVLGETVTELAARLNGCSFVRDAGVPQLVCLAGAIGVGKTTWAQRLAAAMEGQVLCEPYATNPFLPEVYAGHKELGLDSQLYFLVNRAGQLAPASLKAGRLYLVDYLFEQEQIYARRLLDRRQLEVYEKIYPAFADRVCRPVLVILIQDSSQRCLDRIRRRSRPYEEGIQTSFLETLIHDYQALLADWKQCPVMRVQANLLNCLADGDVAKVVGQVNHYIQVQSEGQS
jgi:2-amino-4-hydroxy-6-hydroxymethyldihydropteridine diphosphokinase